MPSRPLAIATMGDYLTEAAGLLEGWRFQTAEGGVTIRGTAENTVSLRAGGPATIVGDVSDATLEVTRGDDTFRCAEKMDLSFTVAGID